jgi:hypothetical protein
MKMIGHIPPVTCFCLFLSSEIGALISVLRPLTSDLKFIKEIQKQVHVTFDAEFALIPGGERYPGFEVFHLEPVFDVDG